MVHPAQPRAGTQSNTSFGSEGGPQTWERAAYYRICLTSKERSDAENSDRTSPRDDGGLDLREVITHVPCIGAQALMVVRMVPKAGVPDVRCAVSTTVRTAASPSAAH